MHYSFILPFPLQCNPSLLLQYAFFFFYFYWEGQPATGAMSLLCLSHYYYNMYSWQDTFYFIIFLGFLACTLASPSCKL